MQNKVLFNEGYVNNNWCRFINVSNYHTLYTFGGVASPPLWHALSCPRMHSKKGAHRGMPYGT
jgi:hypothetical protein